MKSDDLAKNKILFSNSGIAEVTEVYKKSYDGGYEYTVTLKGLKEGNATLSLAKDAVSDSSGNKNVAVSGGPKIVIDATRPVCTFTKPVKEVTMKVGETGTATFVCKDANLPSSGVKLTLDSIVQSIPKVLSFTKISAPKAVSGGYEYTVTFKAIGQNPDGKNLTRVRIAYNYFNDLAGNKNEMAGSEFIRVSASGSSSPSNCKYRYTLKVLDKDGKEQGNPHNSDPIYDTSSEAYEACKALKWDIPEGGSRICLWSPVCTAESEDTEETAKE